MLRMLHKASDLNKVQNFPLSAVFRPAQSVSVFIYFFTSAKSVQLIGYVSLLENKVMRRIF
jgi:hypothetical protein